MIRWTQSTTGLVLVFQWDLLAVTKNVADFSLPHLLNNSLGFLLHLIVFITLCSYSRLLKSCGSPTFHNWP